MDNSVKVREAIWESISHLSDEQLNRVVEEGKWTIAQVLEHLSLIEASTAGIIQHALSIDEQAPAKVKPVYLVADRTRKVLSPKDYEPRLVFQTLDQLKEKLTSSRESLLKSVEGIGQEELVQKSFKHPIFGSLSVAQWVSFVGYHEQRHLKQIEEVKEAL